MQSPECAPEDAAACPGAAEFARAWAKAVTGTSYLPMTREQLERLLERLAVQLANALHGESFDARVGQQVGSELVRAHLSSAEGLGRTIEVVQLRFLRDLGITDEGASERLGRLLAELATGYTRALRDRILDEQESIRRAGMVAQVQAERALRESEARYRYQATHDVLTDLPNRALFNERLNALFGKAARSDRRIGICFIDLDQFKMVNDTLGHQTGDLLLAAMGKRLRQGVAPHLVARLGGDEFVILVEETTGTEDVVKIAEAALETIAQPSVIDGHELTVTASIGLVERPIAGTTPGEMMRDAGITLHWAKSNGKGRWALFDQERNQRALTRYALSAAMPGALERGEFFLNYQPLVCLNGGGILGLEALVRWRHPEFGVLSPDSFIGLAEETGLIVRLGAWVLAEACRDARRWLRADTFAPFVSVNLAVRQVHGRGLVDEVKSLLDENELPPGRLQLEITESALMSTGGEPVRALQELSDLGVRIAIDDFGTGYSNLAYLRTLPVTALKFAGSFVEGLRSPSVDPASDTDERILASLVSLAHTLDLTVTAEGVETARQAERLRAIGCDAAQGWHFGRPAPAELIAGRLL